MKLTIWGVHFTEVSILKELGHQHHGSYSFFREESLCPFTRPLPPLLSPELPLSRAGCLSLACARTATFNVIFSRLTVFTRHDVSSARSFWRVCQDPTLGHGWAPATGFPGRASSLRPAGVAVLLWWWGCQHVGGRLVPCAGLGPLSWVVGKCEVSGRKVTEKGTSWRRFRMDLIWGSSKELCSFCWLW